MKKHIPWIAFILIVICIPLLMGAYEDKGPPSGAFLNLNETAVPPASSNMGQVYVDPNNDLRYQSEGGTDYWVPLSTFDGYSHDYAVKTDNYTITTADFGKTIMMNASTTKTFSLPSVGTTEAGQSITLGKIGVGQLTIDAADSDYIANSGAGDGIYVSATSTYAVITLMYCHTDTRWYILNGNGAWATYD
jgi:hypothetical protein